MSDAALALEARSPQGQAIRLRFDRSYFHRRAENYNDWRLLTAWRDDTLVGLAGAALKPATFAGRPATAAYFFDVRVSAGERRTRLAKQLIDAFEDWLEGKIDLTYGYIVGDNAAAQGLAARIFGNVVTPAFRCLVYPVIGRPRRPAVFATAEGEEVHRRYLAAAGPFDLYCDPRNLFGTEPHVGSWVFKSAAGSSCASVWNNAGIMSEVVDRLPVALSLAGAVLRLPLVRRLPVPRIPARGERIRSWYIFDFHADNEAAARGLVAGLGAEAAAAGIDFLYLIHHADQEWIEAVRADVPRLFAPVIPYCVVGGAGDKVTPVPIGRPYVDVRDV